MLGDRTLYGVRVDGRWRILEFQFDRQGKQGLIPNIGKVNTVFIEVVEKLLRARGDPNALGRRLLLIPLFQPRPLYTHQFLPQI